MHKLILPTLRTFLIGAIALGLLLFLPAWTLDYWQAWVFIIIFMSSMNAVGVYLALNDPALLERRKRVGPAAEQRALQKVIMALAVLGNIALLVVCALDHRFGWSRMATPLVLLGDALVALGFSMNFLVFKANSYGASNIKVDDGQRVISTGPYALVRHPMYSGVLVMLAGAALALGSWWGLAVVGLILPALVWRIYDEELLLRHDLPGYGAYAQKVRHRLVPYIW